MSTAADHLGPGADLSEAELRAAYRQRARAGWPPFEVAARDQLKARVLRTLALQARRMARRAAAAAAAAPATTGKAAAANDLPQPAAAAA